MNIDEARKIFDEEVGGYVGIFLCAPNSDGAEELILTLDGDFDIKDLKILLRVMRELERQNEN